jgi:hypothetical protein
MERPQAVGDCLEPIVKFYQFQWDTATGIMTFFGPSHRLLDILCCASVSCGENIEFRLFAPGYRKLMKKQKVALHFGKAESKAGDLLLTGPQIPESMESG